MSLEDGAVKKCRAKLKLIIYTRTRGHPSGRRAPAAGKTKTYADPE